MRSAIDSAEKPRCEICICTNRPLLCPECVNEACRTTRAQLNLTSLRTQRDTLHTEVQEKLLQRKGDWRKGRESRLRAARRCLQQRAQHTETHRANLEREVQVMRLAIERRLELLSVALQQAKEMRGSRPTSAFQHQYQTALLSACEKESHEELKRGLKQLTAAVGLKRGAAGAQVMEIALPKMIHPMPEISLEIQGRLGAVLGYVSMFLDRLSICLDVPLLHEGRFECSTSHVMKPERIFDLRQNPKWIKYRIYQTQQGNWEEIVAGVELMKRSLRCLAASLRIDVTDSRISLFDLLLLVLNQLCYHPVGPPSKQPSLERPPSQSSSEGSGDEEWCTLDAMVLPPPPSDEVNIVHYETAMTMGMAAETRLTHSFKQLLPKVLPLKWVTVPPFLNSRSTSARK